MRRTLFAWGLLVVAGALGTACDDDGLELTVDLRTDLQPEIDFSSVATTVGNERHSDIVRAGAIGEATVRGARIAERSGLTAGDLPVTVTLRDAHGGSVATRTVRVRLRQDTAVTVIVTRNCRGVVCPRMGNPTSATECLGGRCVSPECGPMTPMSCPVAECMRDSDCTPPVPCARGSCIDGTCLAERVDSRCASGMRCDLALGCVDGPTPVDAGGGDAGPPAPRCGDGACTGTEMCTSCATDCGACPPRCGDRACNGVESCSSCAEDCGACVPVCPDSLCNGTETCTSCSADCGACAPGCPDTMCNGTETCTTCPADCGTCPPMCGDTMCNGTETCATCAGDCGGCPPFCGDGSCNGGESCATCPGDCGNYGHLGSGENDDPCSAPGETWRCAFIPSFDTYGSQVCRGGRWITFHLNPADCVTCCDGESASCY